MGDVIERRRRYYSGLSADKGTIPAGGTAVGDRYFATDTLVDFYWNGAAWASVGPLTVGAAMLQTDAVETLKIKGLNVTAAKLAADAVETLKIKNLNVTTAKAELGFGRFVGRAVAAADKATGDFTINGAWHVDGLDLSAIVPAGAVAARLRMTVKATAASVACNLRTNATTRVQNGLVIYTAVANVKNEGYADALVDADRLMDYNFPATVNSISLYVIGWFT